MVELTEAPVLEVRGIVKVFGGVTALDGVSMSLLPGRVHCLAGENGCGKSTLIKIISGVEAPQAGEIFIDGEAIHRMTPARALRAGIQVIYQDFSLFPNLTVAENIVLPAAIASQKKLFNRARSRPDAQRIVDELGLSLNLDADVEKLSVADRQLTAICRALVQDARIIFMDEPTTALTHSEVERLFALVRTLQERGVALVFVSHKLDEVLEVSHDITVLRSGAMVASGEANDYSVQSLTMAMTGREVDTRRQVNELGEPGAPLLEVTELDLPGAFNDISFDLAPGEILGITGLLGSGRGEIVEALFGLLKPESGAVTVNGAKLRLGSIQSSISAGIGYVPEDRLTQGLFLEKSIADNIIAGSLDRHTRGKLVLSQKRIAETISTLFTRLRIKAPSVAAPVRSLSGGNAQRVVLAKWLATKPKILILNGPTVGVDVGSKNEILTILREAAHDGMGVIMISDDVPELVSICNRVIIVRRGSIVAEFDSQQIEEQHIQEVMAA
ncbi:sugar ABC transporter ATP-binding protein [Paramicrobacterium chengjingii]|uniref:Sugar ABC transporter ATP-binding protein n=1 Tax=Paramicrobacterium chengjingii TaxID=2769067 RepID=A0ABX6YH60_9MICO|nr:sugar ABC transporter ATP-binding protein [Microbacterium chengjingii]QPZ38128.1 sugar ABC transporter ATP-binding protein [Microbacterium chengjingii]